MSVLRCGVIGFGQMGKNHVRVLQEIQEVEFVGVADPSPQLGAESYRFQVFETTEKILEENLDCAIVATPTSLHEPIGLQLAEAGVATLIEKPIATSVSEARRLIDAFDSRGLLVSVGHIERYNPAISNLKASLQDNLLGEVYQIHTSRQSSYPSRINDVGVVKDLASHDIDSTSWISGSTYAKVSAFTNQRAGRNHEDCLIASGQLANGILVNHVISWLSPLKERLTVVVGERGMMIADTLSGDLTLIKNGEFENEWDSLSLFRGISEGELTKFSFAKREPLRIELETFLSAVKGNYEPGLVTPQDGIAVLVVAEAMLESAKFGASMPL